MVRYRIPVDALAQTCGADTDELRWRESVIRAGSSGTDTDGDLFADVDRNGVDDAVIVTNPLYGRGPLAVVYAIHSIVAHPDRLCGVGRTDYHADTATFNRLHDVSR